MSYIGKLPIKIPTNINIVIQEKNLIRISNNNTKKFFKILYNSNFFILNLKDNKLFIILNISKNLNKKQIKLQKNQWGLLRTIIYNQIKGLSQEFKIQLILKGIGYKASIDLGRLRGPLST